MRIELSGCIVINKKKEILVLFRKKYGHYELPGGKVELNETIEQAALRECKEETGVNLELIKYIGYEEFEIEEKKFRSHNFLAEIKENEKPSVTEPHIFESIMWLNTNEYMKYNCASNVRSLCNKINKGEIEI
ncbi:MAG: NUDIX hydrolase [Bacteroidales bacterium]|nr:NUDIX hydrolase [Bacteroidales bacterium]